MEGKGKGWRERGKDGGKGERMEGKGKGWRERRKDREKQRKGISERRKKGAKSYPVVEPTTTARSDLDRRGSLQFPHVVVH